MLRSVAALLLLSSLLLACGAPDAALLPGAGLPNDAGTIAAPDAGARDGGAGTCDEDAAFAVLRDPRETDNACVFDRWMAELPGLTPAEQRARVKAYLDRRDLGSRAPLRTGERVIFVADASQGNVPRLAGAFNGWDPGQGEMQPLLQTGFAFRALRLAPGRYAYKFVYLWKTADESWVPDPAARWVEADGVLPPFGPGTFNAVVFTRGAPETGGAVRVLPAVHSPELQNARDVFVYLPRGALAGGARYPSLYALDGNEMLTRARMDRVADETFAQGRASPAVVVFVPLHEQRERMDEYSFGTNSSRGDRFRAFLADTLVPLVDAAFPTRADVAQRGITGASLGGLMSSYVAWGRNDRFQLVGSQSGSYFWVDDKELLTHEMRAGEKRTLRLYVDNGSPGDNERSNASFVQMLKDRGYPHVHVVEPGGRHEWPDWARRWPAMLAYLFPP